MMYMLDKDWSPMMTDDRYMLGKDWSRMMTDDGYAGQRLVTDVDG